MKTEKSLHTKMQFLVILFTIIISLQLITTLISGYSMLLFVFFTSILLTCCALLLFTLKSYKRVSTNHYSGNQTKLPSFSSIGYLDLFFEHAQDAIAVYSLDFKIVTVNPAFEKLYQWTKEECVGKPIVFYHPSEETHVKKRILLLLEGRHFNNIRTKEIRKDGTLFEADTTLTPIFNKKNKVIAISVITRDITERLESDRLKMVAIKLNAFGELAASVAHEMRNPLTSISGFVQMMNTDPANPYRMYTEIMDNELGRINLIVNEFLILSKPHIKSRKDLNVEHILIDVVHLFEEQLTERNINCDVYLAEYESSILGNEESLKQLFVNLMKNSIDAIQSDGHIAIINSLVNNTISITIRDNGHGIDMNTLEQLFVPFFTTKEDAAGLGLVITKKIILDHKGKIQVNTMANEGAEVTVTFPTTSINKIPTLASSLETN